MRVALVNTNRIKPPISPIGLEYVAEALNKAKYEVKIIELCWEDDWKSAIVDYFNRNGFGLVGVTLRNTDDCALTSSQSFLNEFSEIIATIRNHTDALVVVGGVGFSVMPEQVLEICDADAGIWSDGEFVFVELANRIKNKQEWRNLPNLIWKDNDKWLRNPPVNYLLKELPIMERNFFDNRRYFREGGQIGIETKRGCPCNCIYCADPIAKGKEVRVRPPSAIVDEMENLFNQDIDCFHTCDSEFNIPEWHASEVCHEIIKRNLGDKISWYAYCTPFSFSTELAHLMRRAGCVGINFGVDNGDEEMLKRLKRGFTPDDILNVARWCKDEDITVMFDLLLGSPGETKDSIIRTIELMKKANPESVGVAIGVRIYPRTEIAELVKQEQFSNGLTGGEDISKPLFFIEPEVSPFIFDLLDKMIGDDKRFLFFDPSKPEKNYNYNANQRLVEAIKKGYRGAYWDILRKYS